MNQVSLFLIALSLINSVIAFSATKIPPEDLGSEIKFQMTLRTKAKGTDPVLLLYMETKTEAPVIGLPILTTDNIDENGVYSYSIIGSQIGGGLYNPEFSPYSTKIEIPSVPEKTYEFQLTHLKKVAKWTVYYDKDNFTATLIDDGGFLSWGGFKRMVSEPQTYKRPPTGYLEVNCLYSNIYFDPFNRRCNEMFDAIEKLAIPFSTGSDDQYIPTSRSYIASDDLKAKIETTITDFEMKHTGLWYAGGYNKGPYIDTYFVWGNGFDTFDKHIPDHEVSSLLMQNTYKKMPTSEECKNGSQKLDYYLPEKCAYSMADKLFCAKLAYSLDCITGASIGAKTPETCLELRSDSDRSKCLGRYAFVLNDKSVCDLLPDNKNCLENYDLLFEVFK